MKTALKRFGSSPTFLKLTCSLWVSGSRPLGITPPEWASSCLCLAYYLWTVVPGWYIQPDRRYDSSRMSFHRWGACPMTDRTVALHKAFAGCMSHDGCPMTDVPWMSHGCPMTDRTRRASLVLTRAIRGTWHFKLKYGVRTVDTSKQAESRIRPMVHPEVPVDGSTWLVHPTRPEI
jgi:hypothetical protein